MAKLPRRAEKDPVLKKIWDLFIAPMARNAPVQEDTKRFLDKVFCVDTREIQSYKAKSFFSMPGLKVEAPHVKIQGIGYRGVNKDKILTVRTDSTMPDCVDVEYLAGQGAAIQWYQLSRSEWEKIKSLYLDPYVFLDRHFSEKEED